MRGPLGHDEGGTGVFVMVALDPYGREIGGVEVTPQWRLDANQALECVMTARWPHPAAVAAVTLSFVDPAKRVIKDLGRVKFGETNRTRLPGDSIQFDLAMRVASIDDWKETQP